MERLFRPISQLLALGCFVSGVSTAMSAHRWGAAMPGFLIGFLLLEGTFKAALQKDRLLALRWAGAAGMVISFSACICGPLLVIERLYLSDGDSYWEVLASPLGQVDDQILMRLRARECANEPIEIYRKSEGQWVFRCGTLWEPGNTFVGSKFLHSARCAPPGRGPGCVMPDV